MENRTEFPNLGIVAVILKDFCRPWVAVLEEEYPTPEDKLEAVRNMASDSGNEEVLAICEYLESKGLVKTFFPE
jgi:hypothetical protein